MSEFQDLILNITEEHIKQAAEFIVKNFSLTEERQQRFLIKRILSFIQIRPLIVKTVAKLFQHIDTILGKPDSFTKNIIHTLIGYNKSTNSSLHYPFDSAYYFIVLRQCYLIGYISFDDIYERIKYLFDYDNFIKLVYANFITFFSPELFQKDKSLYSSMIWFLRKQIPKNKFLYIYIPILDEISEESNNLFVNYKNKIDNFFPPDTVYEHILNDDLNQLTNSVSTYDVFDYNMALNSYIYFPSPDFQNNISLIVLSAFLGSVNCFKYILLNVDPIEEQSTDYNKKLLKAAIAGGNIEIVRIILQHECVKLTEDELEAAAKYHRFDIFTWLLEFQGLEITEKVVNAIARYDNIRAFEYCISNNCPLLDQDKNSEYLATLCRICAIYNSIYVFRILSTFDKINFDLPSPSLEVTAISLAASHGSTEILEILIEKLDLSSLNGLKTYKYNTLEDLILSSYTIDSFNLMLDSPKFEITDKLLETWLGKAEYYTNRDFVDYIQYLISERKEKKCNRIVI